MSIILAVLLLLIILLICHCLGLFDCSSGWRRERLSAPTSLPIEDEYIKNINAIWFGIIYSFDGIRRFTAPNYISTENYEIIAGSFTLLGMFLNNISNSSKPISARVRHKCVELAQSLLNDVHKLPKDQMVDCLAFMITFYIGLMELNMRMPKSDKADLNYFIQKNYAFIVNNTQNIIPLLKAIIRRVQGNNVKFIDIDKLIVNNSNMPLSTFHSAAHAVNNNLKVYHSKLNLGSARQMVEMISFITDVLYTLNHQHNSHKNITL
jgi:hypothetical protein